MTTKDTVYNVMLITGAIPRCTAVIVKLARIALITAAVVHVPAIYIRILLGVNNITITY